MMHYCVYLGPEKESLIYGGVYEWRGDRYARSLGRAQREIAWKDQSWIVNLTDAPFHDTLPVCPECEGRGSVPYEFDVDYGPHPDAPDYGNYIAHYVEWVDCPSCHGNGVKIDWSGTLDERTS